jgi:phosphate transport system substrate-binding protein
MKMNRISIVTLAAAVLAATVTVKTARAETIKIDGSSTVYPITEAVAEEFQKSTGGKTRVTVGISGTGGGFKKFCRGETDISDASRPIQKKEMDACYIEGGVKFVEIPIAYDALTVVVHPSNTWAANMKPEDLKKIWAPEAQGQVMKWNQVRPEWPDQPIKLYGPGSDSGTFDYFTEAVVGKAKSSRGDYTASEDDNVLVQGVANDKGGLGYFGYAYYIENQGKLKAVGIDAGKGAVLPSPQTVENGSYQPLSRPIFIYVNAKSIEKPEVKEFVDFYLKNAAKLVASVKYIPLPAQAYTMAQENFAKKKLGTAFAGHSEVGLKVQDLLARETKY